MNIARFHKTEWMWPFEAIQCLGVSRGHLNRHAASWGIRTRRTPGSTWRRYWRADVERVAAEWAATEDAMVRVATKTTKYRETTRRATC